MRLAGNGVELASRGRLPLLVALGCGFDNNDGSDPIPSGPSGIGGSWVNSLGSSFPEGLAMMLMDSTMLPGKALLII